MLVIMVSARLVWNIQLANGGTHDSNMDTGSTPLTTACTKWAGNAGASCRTKWGSQLSERAIATFCNRFRFAYLLSNDMKSIKLFNCQIKSYLLSCVYSYIIALCLRFNVYDVIVCQGIWNYDAAILHCRGRKLYCLLWPCKCVSGARVRVRQSCLPLVPARLDIFVSVGIKYYSTLLKNYCYVNLFFSLSTARTHAFKQINNVVIIKFQCYL